LIESFAVESQEDDLGYTEKKTKQNDESTTMAWEHSLPSTKRLNGDQN
jgi:hypothetical protein